MIKKKGLMKPSKAIGAALFYINLPNGGHWCESSPKQEQSVPSFDCLHFR